MAEYITLEDIKDKQQASLFEDESIVLRPEQEEAIKLAKKRFCAKDGDVWNVRPAQRQFLWNAKMRFGKTLCALQLAREMGVKRTLIVTHRPVVNDSWRKDFKQVFGSKIQGNNDISKNYAYGTLSEDTTHNRGNYYDLEKFVEKEGNHYVFFVSMQYLRLSSLVNYKTEIKHSSKPSLFGHNEYNENEKLKADILNTDWDLVVVDEAHEGTRTELGKRVIDEYLRKNTTKILHLSGTPFNLYEDFDDEEIYTWDYTKEQKSKREWPLKHPGEKNPYEELPRMNFYRYDLAKTIDKYIEEGGVFKFSEFFRTWTGNKKSDDNKPLPTAEHKGKFIHEDDVLKFLDLLCEKNETNNFPFSTDEFRKSFRHTLWVVPGVKEAKALENLLNGHRVFRRFTVVNVAGDNDDDETKDNALEKVLKAIGDIPERTNTITISCGRLTTGVTVKPWTAVFYMKGSEMTSAATYMQTIFRVQSPYKTDDGRIKTECYVFDFAPLRQLKMVAETAKFASLTQKQRGAATLTTKQMDIDNMNEFMMYSNFICLDEGAMDKVDAEAMIGQLQHVYVERVVRNGFNDNSLYDVKALLDMAGDELKEFNDMGREIAKTTNMEKPKNASELHIDNLTPEQREALEKKREEIRRKMAAAKKNGKDPEKELTYEEIAELKREKEEKDRKRKERDNRITILRGISLRIPLILFGAELENEEEGVTLDNFTNLVDKASWEEFMPRGVTKAMFNKFKKCYNPAIFTAAGKSYRKLAREADHMHTDDRIRRIAEIFSYFHNPDKETVLTPWRVVNMHLSDTIGGYCFFNEKFDGCNQKEVTDENGNVTDIVDTVEPRMVDRGEVTKNIFGDIDPENGVRSKVLEINSKTGLYPLYVVYSLYRSLLKVYDDKGLLDNPVDNLSVSEEQAMWDDIVKNNMYVICNTPMAARITKRTLLGFRTKNDGSNIKTNIKEDKLVEKTITNKNSLAKEINTFGYWNGKKDNTMIKFSAVVGNPPYQEINGGGGSSSDPIYDKFVEIAKIISPSYLSFIIPSRWTVGGRYLDEFRDNMINDKHITKFFDYFEPKDIFPQVAIEGGICYFLREHEEKKCDVTTVWGDGSIHHSVRYLKHEFIKGNETIEFDVFVRDENAVGIIEKVVGSDDFTPFSKHVKPRNYFKLDSMPKEATDVTDNIGIWGLDRSKNRVLKYLPNYEIPNVDFENDMLTKWKVFVSKADGAAGQLCYPVPARIIGATMRGGNNIISTITFLVIGPFDTEIEAINVQKFMTTKFFRFLLGVRKLKNVYWKVFSFVPYLDFTKEWCDKDLYAKYRLTTDEINHIENMIKDFDNELMLF